MGQSPTAPSGWEWNGSQSGQGAAELGFPWPALWQIQGKQACRAGEPSGEGEEPPPEGLGGHDLLTQADAGCLAGQVVRHHLSRQPGAVGGEAARGKMVQPDAVFEVAYRILDLGVAAVVSLQFQGLSVPVGDEAVITVGGEEGQLGSGRGLHSPDDEPHRCGVGLGMERSVEPVSATSAAACVQIISVQLRAYGQQAVVGRAVWSRRLWASISWAGRLLKDTFYPSDQISYHVVTEAAGAESVDDGVPVLHHVS